MSSSLRASFLCHSLVTWTLIASFWTGIGQGNFISFENGHEISGAVSNAFEVNITVILPFNPYYKASLLRVGPGMILGFEEVKRRQLLPNHKIFLTYHDSQCSNIFAPLKANKAAYSNSVHAFFGPSCELALAPVARFLKFWNTPLLTGGALTFDFQEPKTTNDTEYFLTTRTGFGFKEIVEFTLSYFHRFNWKKVMLIYDKDDMDEVSGPQTCKLFMSTLVEYLKKLKWPYGNFDLETNNINATIKENLAKELGLEYSGETRCQKHPLFFCDTTNKLIVEFQGKHDNQKLIFPLTLVTGKVKSQKSSRVS